MVESNFPRSTTNQKHDPDLGSDASSVWNFSGTIGGKPVEVSPNVGCFLRLAIINIPIVQTAAKSQAKK